MKILKKNSAYIIEIEQSEKETGRTMYNTRHELAKLITHKERLQSNWNSLREELYQANRELVTNELVNGKELINNIIAIMNELEGADNENYRFIK